MDESHEKGIITDIQRFSVHDGFGIRTSVFLKGCNMRCAWCHNPETIAFEPEVLVDPDKCIGCELCELGCYSGARRAVGREMTAEQVLREVRMDLPYYGEDGGMTLTGGEPCCQGEFSHAMLRLARAAHIHTAMETNLNAPESLLSRLLPLCDLLMCDLKLWDEKSHLRWTGVGNARIKHNLTFVDGFGVPIMLRTPVVVGVNDSEEEIGAIAGFAARLKNLLAYELLPYHALGASKRIQGAAEPLRFEAPPKERVAALSRHALSMGVPVRVSGMAVKGA